MPQRRRASFLISIFILIFSYFALQLIWRTELEVIPKVFATFILLVPFGWIAWMPLVYWKLDTVSRRDEKRVWASYSSMALLSFILMTLVGRDALSLLIHFKYDSRESLIVLGIALALLGLGVFRAFFGLQVSEIEVPIRNLPESFDGFRIVQISDLHIGPTIQTGFVSKVVSKINSLNADLFALTGDAVDGMVSDLRMHFEKLSEISARFGRFYVTGNHEYYWDAPGWIEEVRRVGLTPLINENRVIEKDGAQLVIAGVTDIWSDHFDAANPSSPKKAIEGAPSDAPKILLAHQPLSSKEAAEVGFDLQLSGHTHAGQFIPWVWLIRFFHEHYKGLNRVGSMWLYVNRGTGHWGPPVRLGAPPEIAVIILRKAP